jgi:hypothetical protein
MTKLRKTKREYSDVSEMPPEASQDLTGQSGILIDIDGKPVKLPKKKRKGAKESYRPFTGTGK